jgi:hypothetical protein
MFEVKLLQAEGDSSDSRCGPTESFLESASSSPEVITTPRTLFKLAQIAKRCGKSDQAQALLLGAARANVSPENLPWIIQATDALGTGDIAELKAALRTSIPASDHQYEITAFSSHRWYVIGLDQAALGDSAVAEQSFLNALLLPDSHMSHHLARIGLASLPASPARERPSR